MMGMGTPSNQSRSPRPISVPFTRSARDGETAKAAAGFPDFSQATARSRNSPAKSSIGTGLPKR